MVTAIFNEISSIVNAFVTMLGSLFTSVADIFYTPGTSGSAGSLTLIGTLSLIGLGTGLVIWAFNFVRRLIRVRNK